MKIVITGGAGFIGSHLVDRLVQDGCGEIVVVDNLHRGKLANIQGHIDRSAVTFHQADIRDAGRMTKLMKGAELVYHLAAQSNVLGAVADVDYSFTTNVVGTLQRPQGGPRSGGAARDIHFIARSVRGARTHPRGRRCATGGQEQLRRQQGGRRGILPRLSQRLRPGNGDSSPIQCLRSSRFRPRDPALAR